MTKAPEDIICQGLFDLWLSVRLPNREKKKKSPHDDRVGRVTTHESQIYSPPTHKYSSLYPHMRQRGDQITCGTRPLLSVALDP